MSAAVQSDDPKARAADCVAWMFRATQLRCQTFIGRLIFDTCDTHDCFVGLMDDRLEGNVDLAPTPTASFAFRRRVIDR